MNKLNKKENKKFSFNWKSGISHLKNKYTSVELQHRINDYRGNILIEND